MKKNLRKFLITCGIMMAAYLVYVMHGPQEESSTDRQVPGGDFSLSMGAHMNYRLKGLMEQK